jgi:hypothetical protein
MDDERQEKLMRFIDYQNRLIERLLKESKADNRFMLFLTTAYSVMLLINILVRW